MSTSGARAQDTGGEPGDPADADSCSKSAPIAPRDPGGWGPVWEEDAAGLRPAVALVSHGDDAITLEVRVTLPDGDVDVQTLGPIDASDAEVTVDLTLPEGIDGRMAPVDVIATASRADTGERTDSRGLHGMAYRTADGAIALVGAEVAMELTGLAGVVWEDGTAEDGASGWEVSP